MRQATTLPALGSIAVLLGWLSVSCGGGTPTDPALDDRSTTRSAFLAARSKWTTQRISDYEYSYRRLCFCVNTDPVRITVRDGRVSQVVLAGAGSPISSAGYPTVDDLFAQLLAGLERGAHEIQAAYDPVLGYPTSFYIDPIEGAIDDEQRVEAGALERLP